MSDKDYIEQAYASQLQKAYGVLFESLLEAEGDPGEEATALNSFKAALALARKARSAAEGVL